MKSYPSRFKKNCTFLCKIALAALFLMALASCSDGGGQAGIDQAEVEAEINQLMDENEKLHTELDEANSKLEAAEAKVEELENELEAMQETQDAPSSPEPVKADITPPELTDSELLVGQWFLQDFHEDGQFSWTQTFVFNTNGTGTISRRYYVPKSEIEEIEELKSYGLTVDDLDSSDGISWSLSDNTVHIELDNGETGDFIFSPEQQLLQLKGGNDKYGKEAPSIMEQYVARSLYAEDSKAREAARMRRFLGTWYFDVMVWTFNEDGTCIIDIPELANQPATTLEYTYSVADDSNDPTYLCLMLDSDKGTSYFYPEFATDGSVSLKGIDGSEAMKLTRQFDMSNCPISTQIIQTGMDVFTGRIFYDMLGIEE